MSFTLSIDLSKYRISRSMLVHELHSKQKYFQELSECGSSYINYIPRDQISDLFSISFPIFNNPVGILICTELNPFIFSATIEPTTEIGQFIEENKKEFSLRLIGTFLDNKFISIFNLAITDKIIKEK